MKLDNLFFGVPLHQALQQLKDLLPSPEQSREKFQTWWQTSYPAWMERLKAIIANYRNIQHHWHFSLEQQQVLQQYLRCQSVAYRLP